MNEAIPPTPLDTYFAALMVKLHGQPNPALHRAAETVSAWRGAGHICVPLPIIGETQLGATLLKTGVVGTPGEFKPLILDERNRLYLQRYWEYERSLARSIQARLGSTAGRDNRVYSERLKPFCLSASQQVATRAAVENNFCVITGGPGTGKTRTAVVILALLLETARANGRRLRVAVTAPTGKAASRMKESIRELRQRPEFAAARDGLPDDATTMHRLLGAIPQSPYFRHDAKSPLSVDVVIVDEASMVDLALMAKLFAAVPMAAKIILLGDKDQLASVEAGNVLGDICNTAGNRESLAPISRHIVELKENFRFEERSGIHQLSTYVNGGRSQEAIRVLSSGATDDIQGFSLPPPGGLLAALRERIVAGYRRYLQLGDNPKAALIEFDRFRILTALRRGPFGTENLNRICERVLAEANLLDSVSTYYRGRPVLVLANDYDLKLFNGDVGLILPDPDAGGDLRAFFRDADGGTRSFLPTRLPEHETVFAMTVHKSQGSEFERVLLLLPDQESPVFTRELIYTGLTRAKHSVEVWHRPAALRPAIEKRIERTSGLRDALWLELG